MKSIYFPVEAQRMQWKTAGKWIVKMILLHNKLEFSGLRTAQVMTWFRGTISLKWWLTSWHTFSSSLPLLTAPSARQCWRLHNMYICISLQFFGLPYWFSASFACTVRQPRTYTQTEETAKHILEHISTEQQVRCELEAVPHVSLTGKILNYSCCWKVEHERLGCSFCQRANPP